MLRARGVRDAELSGLMTALARVREIALTRFRGIAEAFPIEQAGHDANRAFDSVAGWQSVDK